MTPRTYASPGSFKQALEQRLMRSSGGGAKLVRQRQLVVFDRFLARVAEHFGDAITLKGGLVLEKRLEHARTTRDVDLRLTGSSDDLLDRLQTAGRLPAVDFMTFEVEPDPAHPTINNEGVRYEGRRFRARCRLGRQPYADLFGVDVAMADPIFGAPEILVGDDLLAFAGIAPPSVRVYPIETHVADTDATWDPASWSWR